MTWILLALVAHAGNALVFVVDKSLLGKKKTAMSNPRKYALYSGLLAGAAVILLPFTWAPLTIFILHWSLLAGLFHLAALYFFFRALKYGEPSRVVPIVGSAVPIFTLMFAVAFSIENITLQQLGAVLLLILGGTLLSAKATAPRSLGEVGLAGLLFAAYFVTIKYLYDQTSSFLAVFAWSRVVEGVIAGALLTTLTLKNRSLLPLAKGESRHLGGEGVSIVFVANKVLAAGAFLLQSYALSLGSVTVVNSLQGTQYVFLLILAVAVSSWFPKLFREEFSRVAWGQKIAGIVLISLGVTLLV